MATSGTTAFSLTANQAVTAALQLIQTCAQGITPDATSAATALQHAEMMLKTWGTQERLWIATEGTLALVASTASYSLPLARRVTSVRRRASNIDVPLLMMSRQEYNDFPSKAATGVPYQFYFDPQRATRTLYVINVPDATTAASTTLQYTYMRVIEDVSDLTKDLDIPQEWLETFVYALAARLLIPFARFVTDPTTAAEIKQRATELYAELSAQDAEDASVFFQPA